MGGAAGRRICAHAGGKGRTAPDAGQVAALAREFADWRFGGCPGYGFQKAFKAKVDRVARRHKVSYGEVWALVHAEAYKTISDVPRARLKSQAE